MYTSSTAGSLHYNGDHGQSSYALLFQLIYNDDFAAKGSGPSVLTTIATDGTKNAFQRATNRINFVQQNA